MISAQLSTRDGHSLAADLALPDATPDAPPDRLIGAVVVCHPHPQYGGNRFDTVVGAVFDALPPAGFAALRFDFRADFGGGVAERADVVAALDHLDTIGALEDLPHFVVGYSFGAAVALGVRDARITAVGAIAPPLSMLPVDRPDRPTLVLTPRHDQFCDPAASGPIVADWPDNTFEVIESADHFLAGHTAAVAARVTRWLQAFDV